jgi:hypothetical protein
MQILLAWRSVGLIHGDIKPQNIVVYVPPWKTTTPHTLYYRGVVVYLIDVEGIVHLPLCPTTDDGDSDGACALSVV